MAVFNAGSIEATLDLDVDPFQRGLTWARAEGKRFAQEKWTAKIDADTTLAARGANNLRRSLERVEGTYRANVEVTGVAEAAVEAAGLNQELKTLGRSRTSVDVDTRQADRNIARTRRGIIGMLAPLAILSTGAIPLGAAAVPALGLANNLTLAAGGIGTLVLGAQGVGEALKAANEAGAEPTAENLLKARQAMAELTPEARAFVHEFQTLAGPGGMLQRTAAAGGFPGITDGLGTLRQVLPEYKGLIYELSDATGDNLGATLMALDDPRWRGFADFLHAEARPGIDDLSAAFGNLAGAAAGWWQAFDPLNDDFGDWLVDWTGRVRDAAEGLPQNGDFQQFIAYVREQGPEAADTLLALGGALVDVVTAAAPLGGVVLDVLEGVGEAISFIAEQPFGDTLLTGLAALYALNKTLTITEGLMKRAGLATTGAGAAGIAGGLQAKAQAGVSGIKGIGSDLALLGRTSALASGSAERELSGANAAAARLRGTLGTIGKAGAGLGAVSLLATGASDSLGLTNTTMLALAGTMTGQPLAAAAGAAVGLLLDIKAAAGSATEGIEAYKAATSNQFVSFSQTQAAGDALAAAKPAPEFMRALAIGTSPEEAEAQTRAYEAAVGAAASRTGDLELAAAALAKQYGIVSQSTANSAITTEQLDSALVKAQPAMAALGISTEDLQNAAAHGGLPQLLGQLIAYQERADSAGGRTRAFAMSVADLGNNALSAAEGADAMATALEALLGPALGVEQATDQWRVSLRTLANQLKAGAGFEGYTKAALANRQITRDYTTDSMERLTALAKVSSTTEQDMARAVAATRREFIKSGVAAGFSRKQIVARADALGLTPKLVATVFKQVGIDQADLRARRLREAYRNLPADVRTAIREEGSQITMAKVNQLIERYELTEKQRQAIISAIDRATPTLSSVDRWLNLLDGKHATTYIDTIRTGQRTVPGLQMATGGPVYGPGTGTSDSVPTNLSNGEHVMTAREVVAAGGHGAVEDMRRAILEWGSGKRPPTQRLAVRDSVAVARGTSSSDIDRLVEAIRANRGLYVSVSARADLLAAWQALDSQLRNSR